MANSLNNIGVQIAQKSLDLLVNRYPALSQVSTDFSDASVPHSGQITTRVINPGTASDFNVANGYTASDISTTAVNITLNKWKHSTFTLNGSDLTATSQTMINDFAGKVASEIGDAIYTDVAALFTTGNYGNSTTAAVTIAAQGIWGYTGVINAANTALNKRKVGKDRIAIYNSDLYGSMWADSIVRNGSNLNQTAIGDAYLPTINQVVLTDYPALPTTSNLVGVQMHKSAVAVATRVPESVPQSAGTPVVAQVQNVVHPDLGLAMQVRSWEDAGKGSLNVACTLIYGVKVANTGCAQLIVTS